MDLRDKLHKVMREADGPMERRLDRIMDLLEGPEVTINKGSYGPDWCGIDCSLKKCPYAIHDGMSGPCKPGPDCPGPGKYRLVRIGDS